MLDPQAKSLNETLQKENNVVFEMLSEKGKNIFFPKQGILAQAAQARGKEINATIGEARADDGKSLYLSEFDKYVSMDIQDIYPYAPSPGKPDIRSKWKSFIYEKNPSLESQLLSNPIATNGLTHAISIAAYLFVDQTDSVVLPDLYWENYDLIFDKACNATIKTYKTFTECGLDINAFSSAINSVEGDKVVILLNFPNNPTGYTPTFEEADQIQKEIELLAQKGKKVVVLIDDAYFGLVYEKGIITESIFTKLCNLHENILSVKIDGPTKEDYVWGFRVGFLTYGIKNGSQEMYEALEAKTGGAIRGNISNISNLSQSLLMKVYESENYNDLKKEKYEVLNNRYITLRKALDTCNASEYFHALPYNSGYFMCIRVSSDIEAEKVRQVLLEKYSTGIIVFQDIIRIAFSAVPIDKIELLVNNIKSACSDVKNA